MSLFEWFGESYNPGGAGSVNVSGRDRGRRSRAAVLVCFVVALALLGLWCYALWSRLGVRSGAGLAIAAGLTLVQSALRW